jgi:hypothetical protein
MKAYAADVIARVLAEVETYLVDEAAHVKARRIGAAGSYFSSIFDHPSFEFHITPSGRRWLRMRTSTS